MAESHKEEKSLELNAFNALASLPRLSDLTALARNVILPLASSRSSALNPSAVAIHAEEAKLSREEAESAYGNVMDVLSRGPETEQERALCAALCAHVVADAPPKGRDAEDQMASDLLWLGTHTPFDATRLLDRALGEAADDLWDAISDRVRRIDQGRLPSLGRGEALLGCSALSLSSSSVAKRKFEDLATTAADPALRILAVPARVDHQAEKFTGEIESPPRGAFATVALGVTGLLFAIHAVRIIGRLALAYRTPAAVTFSRESVEIESRTELLGKTIREQKYVVPRAGLTSAVREVRYPRAALYAGLLSLSIGTYVGVSTLVDGVRAASPSLLVVGLAIVIAGLAIDFLFASFLPAKQGVCRVIFTPAKGRAVSIGRVDPKVADRTLAHVAGA